jgi:quinol-cytochrome oxidoreductase complex cytochrome b subunit
VRALLHWIDEQTGLVSASQRFLEYPLPRGVGWPQTLGSLALFLFGLQIVTGVFLALYYVPTPDHAYDSVMFLRGLPLGRLIYNLHHYGTDALAVVIGLHMVRAFLWGAYKKPRQMVWVVGVILLVLTMGFTITGALLPWDQNGYWATKIRLSLAAGLPVLGPILQQLGQGGATLGAVTLTRFYSLHLFFLPAFALLLMGFHVFQVRIRGITPPWRRVGEEQDVEKPILYYPDHTLKIALLCLGTLLGILLAAAFWDARIEPPADPTSNFPAHTHWYFLYLFEFVHLFPGKLQFIGSMVIPTLALVAYFLLPYVDRNPERRLSRRPFAIPLVMGAFIAVTALGIRGSRSSPHEPHLTRLEQQGQKLFFDMRCQACHGINGGGGTGGPDLASGGGKRSAPMVETMLRTPQKLNPRSIMPAANLPPDQMKELVAYVLSITPSSVMPTAPQIGPPKPMSHRQGNFMLDHKFEVRKDPQACAECHQPTFCQECHQKRKPDSHLHNWLPQHAGAAQASGAFCQVCHDQQSCDNCHRQLLHGPGWLAVHKNAATEHGNVCAECHTPTFCAQCHQGARPPSHAKPDFMQIHGTLVMGENCAECHGQNPCETCHNRSNPHPPGWEKTHGPVAVAHADRCAVCHTDRKTFCDGCHKLPMPHPAGWLAQHKSAAKSAGANCQYCHQQRECEGCHHEQLPASHTAVWRQTHGAVAKKGTQDCMLCHQQASCNACHQLPMPHPDNWVATHQTIAARREATCANCHTKKDCLQCHQDKEIHLPIASLPNDTSAALRLAAEQPGNQPVKKCPACPAMSQSPPDDTTAALRLLAERLGSQETKSCPACPAMRKSP